MGKCVQTFDTSQKVGHIFKGKCVQTLDWYCIYKIRSMEKLKTSFYAVFLSARGPVCLCRLCGGAVFSCGQWCLQLSLPSHPAPHEGLPLPLRCHPPPHPSRDHGVSVSSGYNRTRKIFSDSFCHVNNILLYFTTLSLYI